MNHRRLSLAALSFVFGLMVASVHAQTSTPQSLAGSWRFAMDRTDAGAAEKWFAKDLTDRIQLPGILQSQGYGDEISINTPWVAALPRDMRWYLLPQYKQYTVPGNIKVPYLSQPVRHYLGLAWYQRDIDVPATWQGKRIHFFMERPRWETTVWVDDKQIGSNNSLCAPHEYDLGILTPGKHRLTVRADNRMTVVPGYRPDGHSVSDALGSSWNGIAGRIELTATSPVWIDDAQAFPNIEKKSVLVRVNIGNLTGSAGAGTLSSGNTSAAVKWDEKSGQAEIEVPLGSAAKLWDEFNPVLHNVTVRLDSPSASDSRSFTVGLRQITTNGKQLLINGKEVNFRGTHSGGDFPLTGYPATDVASWKRILQTCKDFGLNHIRFHSWCPPEAAFSAADELGVYLAPECGMWNPFNPGDAMSKMLELETARIKKAYGNHPSFVMLAASNETSGRWQGVLNPWAANWYKDDPRRLYCTNTGRSDPAAPGAQYAATPYRSTGGWFGRDYSQNLRTATMPVLAHEVGQWCSYPDYDLIGKFTGYLQGKNYEIYRESAVAHGVIDQNKDFVNASGKFQLACYKEEIEANLRTPGASGFQLLDLHDYIGQGGALVGLLDPFWDTKSYVTAEGFRRFCNSTVPLARMTQSIYRNNEPFSVSVELAHYGQAPLAMAKPAWKIVDLAGATVAAGEFAALDVPIGKNIPLGKVELDLSKLPAPRQYKLVVGLSNTAFENDWNFWLYPAQVDTATPTDVTLTSDWKEASDKLQAGGKVLFVPPVSILDSTCPPLNNVPVFWNRLMVPKANGEAMLGLLVNDKHPALAEFPTQGYCDWNWNELVRNVRAINVEKLPREFRPIVQAVDDWSRNYKLGVVFEAKVGTGRLVVCSIDLASNLETRIGARQLRRSLLAYMGTERFQPPLTVTLDQASALWPGGGPSAPTSAPAPQALPGDVIEGPNTPRPNAR